MGLMLPPVHSSAPKHKPPLQDVEFLVLALVAITVVFLAIFTFVYFYFTRDAGYDFHTAYLGAAQRLMDGQSPYLPNLLSGPIPAQTGDAYLYPPTFAWLITPFLALPRFAATLSWVWLQILLVALAVGVAARAAQAELRPTLVLGLTIATLLYIPTFDSLSTGNVGMIVALGMALLLHSAVATDKGGKSAGPIAVVLGVLELAPGLVLLPVLAANPRLHLPRALAALAILTLPFIALNPGAWIDFVRVPFNLATGNSWYHNNIAPGTVFAYYWPATREFTTLLRIAALAGAGGLLIVSLIAARRSGGLPAAICAAAAASILPLGTIWQLYLTALLPGIIFAWLRADWRGRSALSVGYLLLLVGFFYALPLEAVGMAILMIAPVIILWPPHSRAVLAVVDENGPLTPIGRQLRDDPAHAATRIGQITDESGDEVQMGVTDGLTAGDPHIEPEIPAVGRQLVSQPLAHRVGQI